MLMQNVWVQSLQQAKYTYDFEGKVLVQKPPDMERYPKSY